MDFKTIFITFSASIVIVLVRIVHLILYPYRTMRKISYEEDWLQIGIIGAFVLGYFFIGHQLRPTDYPPLALFYITAVHVVFSAFFFYKVTQFSNKNVTFMPFLSTWTYTLIPTLIWFIATSYLYYLLPPPRTFSILGKTFSIVYIAFSVSLLIWKIILCYLSIRFSSRMHFYRIIYFMVIYTAVFIPYAIILYAIGMFRIPFI